MPNGWPRYDSIISAIVSDGGGGGGGGVYNRGFSPRQ